MLNYTDEDIITLKTGNHIKYKDLLVKIATFLYVETAYETTSNNWTTYFQEVEEALELEDGFIDKEIANDVAATLYTEFENQVAEVEIYYETEADCYHEVDRYFDVTLYENYCLGYVEDDQSIIEFRGEE